MNRLLLALLVAVLLLPAAVSQAAGPTCGGRPATIVGTSGDDVLPGTFGDDVIWAGDGDDVVRGRGGQDRLCGGDGDDAIYDGPEHGPTSWPALLYGGAGNDRLYLDAFGAAYGGPGKDTFLIKRGDHDLYGGPGRDTLDARRSPVAVAIDLRPDFAEGSGYFSSALGAADLFDIENATGSPYGDDIGGDQRANVLRGLHGDDLEIAGRGGDDRLIGGAGADRLLGGAGDDYLSGGPHVGDWLDGGTGSDTCVDPDGWIVLDNCESAP